MNVEFTKAFVKQLDKVKDPIVLKRIKAAILKAESAEDVYQISGIKKLVGFEKYFRIRIGDYRIGLVLKDDVVWFAAIAHRKDIYNIFP
jgi:mRNA interferase RelE/StbE